MQKSLCNTPILKRGILIPNGGGEETMLYIRYINDTLFLNGYSLVAWQRLLPGNRIQHYFRSTISNPQTACFGGNGQDLRPPIHTHIWILPCAVVFGTLGMDSTHGTII